MKFYRDKAKLVKGVLLLFLTTQGSTGKCLPVVGEKTLSNCQNIEFLLYFHVSDFTGSLGVWNEQGWSSIFLWPEGEQILSLL